MLESNYQKKFRKDYILMGKRHKNLDKLDEIMAMIVLEEKLPEHCREHLLSGDLAGLWECHIEGDWVLIYNLDYADNQVYFLRTGTHADVLNR